MRTPTQLVVALRGVPILAGLRRETLMALATRSTVRSVPAGTRLTTAGMRGSELFVILTGTVDVSRGGASIARLGEGDFVGEISLLDGGPRSADVTTTTECDLLVVSAGDFAELLAIPHVSQPVIEALCARIRSVDERFAR